MKIAIHSRQFDGRGSGKVPYEYGMHLKSMFGYDVIFIASNLSKNEGIPKLKEHFKVFTHDYNIDSQSEKVKVELEKFVDTNKIDFMYMLKSGENDKITPDNCKTGIHCVFNMLQNHGSIYAGVSEYLAKKFNQTLYVPHIIKNVEPTVDVRKEMGISDDTLVVGRIGGMDSFDLPFVHESIKRTLNTRKNILFFFVSTNPFYYDDKLLYIPWLETEEEKFNIIHACDVMIHGRHMGETFGLACGEFSVANKPVITWSGGVNPNYDKCHLNILGDKAIIYNNGEDLFNTLLNLERKNIKDKFWDVYSSKFNETAVMTQYKNIFLT